MNYTYVKGMSFLYFLLCFLSNCTNNNQTIFLDDVSIVIDVDEIKGWVTLDTFNYNVRYVRLETNEHCLIGRVSKSLIRQNKIYVADFNNAIALFVFDLQGKHLFTIDRRGKGPGEYLKITDFDIDTNGNIYIYDIYNEHFLVYDSIGVYKNSIKIGYQISSFCIMNDIIYCSDLSKNIEIDANLAVFNLLDKNTHYVIPSRKILDDYRYIKYSPFKFYQSSQQTYYSPKFSSVIYCINEKGIQPAIGLKNLKMPPENALRKWLQQPESMTWEPYFLETVNIYETEKYMYFTIKQYPDIFLLYDKENKKPYNLNSLNRRVGISEMKGSTGKVFWGIMNPDPKYHENLLKTQKELKQWKEEDNPVIVFIEFNY